MAPRPRRQLCAADAARCTNDAVQLFRAQMGNRCPAPVAVGDRPRRSARRGATDAGTATRTFERDGHTLGRAAGADDAPRRGRRAARGNRRPETAGALGAPITDEPRYRWRDLVAAVAYAVRR